MAACFNRVIDLHVLNVSVMLRTMQYQELASR